MVSICEMCYVTGSWQYRLTDREIKTATRSRCSVRVGVGVNVGVGVVVWHVRSGDGIATERHFGSARESSPI